jgi:hypothetical protein
VRALMPMGILEVFELRCLVASFVDKAPALGAFFIARAHG